MIAILFDSVHRVSSKEYREQSYCVMAMPEQIDSKDFKDDLMLAEVLRRLVDAYPPERIYLFGSMARGEAGPDSDYDLLVVVPDDTPPERRKSRLAYQVLRGTKTATDVLVCNRSYFKAREHLKASLPGIVLREGKRLYVA